MQPSGRHKGQLRDGARLASVQAAGAVIAHTLPTLRPCRMAENGRYEAQKKPSTGPWSQPQTPSSVRLRHRRRHSRPLLPGRRGRAPCRDTRRRRASASAVEQGACSGVLRLILPPNCVKHRPSQNVAEPHRQAQRRDSPRRHTAPSRAGQQGGGGRNGRWASAGKGSITEKHREARLHDRAPGRQSA